MKQFGGLLLNLRIGYILTRVEKPLWVEGYNEIEVDETSYIKSQLQGNAERIERLQSEMIHVMNELSKLKKDGKE